MISYLACRFWPKTAKFGRFRPFLTVFCPLFWLWSSDSLQIFFKYLSYWQPTTVHQLDRVILNLACPFWPKMVKNDQIWQRFSALFLAKLFGQFLSDIAYVLRQTFLFRTIYNLPYKFACILRYLHSAGVHFSWKNMANLEFSRYVLIIKIGAVLTNADQRFLSIILAVVIRFTSNLFHEPLLLVPDNCTVFRKCDIKFGMPILAENCQIWPI